MKNKIYIIKFLFTFLLCVSNIHAQYEHIESPEISHFEHIDVEVLQWSTVGTLTLDTEKKYHLGLGFSNSFEEYGKEFNSMTYIVTLNSKLTEQLSLNAGYSGGPIDKVGWIHGFVLGPEYKFKNSVLDPRLRLLYNYVAFEKSGIKNSHRIRLRLAMSHDISKKKEHKIIFRTEPFLYKSGEGAFKEIRTTIGPYFNINKHIGLSTVYENRWSEKDNSETLRHTLSISLNLNLDRLKD